MDLQCPKSHGDHRNSIPVWAFQKKKIQTSQMSASSSALEVAHLR